MATRNELRQQVRAKRKNLSRFEQQHCADNLLTQLRMREDVNHAKNIAIYLANDSELDPMPFINWCWQENKSTYLPVIHPFSAGHLLFLHFDKNSVMQPNQYGILEPKLDVRLIKSINDIDIIFTPLVAFDPSGNRLGMGGGFYDRTLSLWYLKYQTQKQQVQQNAPSNSRFKPYPIGLAHDVQMIAQVPSQHWDIPLPEIITPTKQYKFNIC